MLVKIVQHCLSIFIIKVSSGRLYVDREKIYKKFFKTFKNKSFPLFRLDKIKTNYLKQIEININSRKTL